MSILDAILGQDPGAGDRNSALQQFSGINAPSAEELQYILQNMVYQGDITPEMAQSVIQDPSLFNQIQTNPAGRAAQLKALEQIQGIASEGGMTAQDKAQLNDIQSQSAQAERGGREAILMNARERGVGGSGVALASQMLNQQSSADRANSQGLDVAAMAQQRALDAIRQSGELGGQIQSQQFSEEAQKAQAQDAINQFNTANRQDVVNANTMARNNAQYRNTDMKQDISNQNVSLANEKARSDAAAKQQAFDNQMKKATGTAGAYQDIAGGKQSAQNAQLGFFGGIANAAGTAYGGNLAAKKKKEGYL